MYQKRCDRCRKYSYSSDSLGRWVCPYCNRDISYVKEQPADPCEHQNMHVVKDLLKEDSA